MSQLSDATKELTKRVNRDTNEIDDSALTKAAYEVAVEYGVDYDDLIEEYVNSMHESASSLKRFVRVFLESNEYIRDELNPKLFKDEKLDPEVREHALRIADSFKENLEKVFPNIEIEDIKLVGSNANYNYTPMSDVDIHLVVDYSKLDGSKELLDGYFNNARMLYNFNHDIKIKGHDAEVYVEDSTVQPESSGVYSIKDDKWLIKPAKEAIDVDDDVVMMKYNSLKNEIDTLINDYSDIDYAQDYYHKLFEMRKSALALGGEYSVENLAFKKLRNDGSIDKLRNYIRDLNDKNLSLEKKNDSIKISKNN